MNSNYLVSSKNNSKDTEKEDSSSSVTLLDANKKKWLSNNFIR